MITLKLPYPISANRYWSRRIVQPKGKPAIVIDYVTPEARVYRDSVGWLARQAGVRDLLRGRIRMELDLYPHRPLDWEKRQRQLGALWADTVQCIDLGNCEKVIGDALQGIVYVNDSQIHAMAKNRMDPIGEAQVIVRISEIPNPQLALALPEPVETF